MKYNYFSAEDFALDDAFRAHVLRPNAESEVFWEEWIEENPDYAEELELARQMVLSIQFSEISISEEKVDSMVQQINEAIDNQPSQTRKRGYVFWGSRVAAAILLLAVSVLSYQRIMNQQDVDLEVVEVAYVTKEVPLGQKSTITLGDGTKVKLNSGSTFRFPETFSDTLREVYLTGEAFFDVAKNPDKPFVIHSQGVETRVLGTSFNISAYPTSENVSIAVATGKVKVKLSENKKRSEVLIPNQMFVYHKSKGRAFKAEDINLADLLAWKDKRIVFNKSLHDEIIETLERWYGVTFVVNKKLETGTGYTAQFKPNKSLKATLECMKYSLGFEYKLENNIVTLN
ncbi:FecR family protein [Reichenbachiella sp.]|uniref:FecR family protein n=1 Tax=Reichenbachiella sp. TaxID=2184521 RepID=UPI003BAF87E0